MSPPARPRVPRLWVSLLWPRASAPAPARKGSATAYRRTSRLLRPTSPPPAPVVRGLRDGRVRAAPPSSSSLLGGSTVPPPARQAQGAEAYALLTRVPARLPACLVAARPSVKSRRQTRRP